MTEKETRLMCEEAFYGFKNIADELRELSNKIENLNAIVQNYEFILYNNFDCFENDCIKINEDMNRTFSRTRNSLNSLYEIVYEIYNNGE